MHSTSYSAKLVVLSSLAFFGCAATPSSEPTAESSDTLPTNLAQAKACAIRTTYEAADLTAFTHLTHAQLPSALAAMVPPNAQSRASFKVPNVGTVYLVQEFDGDMSFYDASASTLAQADPDPQASGTLTWTLASGTAVLCGPQVYKNETAQSFPYGGATESSITVSGRTGNGAVDTEITIGVTHNYPHYLSATLYAPDGSIYYLALTGATTTVRVNLSNEPLNGTWKLRVSDYYYLGSGKLDRWSMTL